MVSCNSAECGAQNSTITPTAVTVVNAVPFIVELSMGWVVNGYIRNVVV